MVAALAAAAVSATKALTGDQRSIPSGTAYHVEFELGTHLGVTISPGCVKPRGSQALIFRGRAYVHFYEPEIEIGVHPRDRTRISQGPPARLKRTAATIPESSWLI
jgi:hypothetical protein